MAGKVSVIIPAYNAEKFIGEAIESVLNQTYKNIEIIVVDDGSKDNTYQVVKQNFGNQVKLIRKKNGGVSSARNMGVKNAEGEFIAYLDADDYWLPQKLEIQLRCFEKFPECGLCYTDAYINGKKTRGVNYPIFKDHSWSYKDIFESSTTMDFTINNSLKEIKVYYGYIFDYLIYNGMILPSTAVVKKSIINKWQISWDENNNLAEDSDYFLRLSKITNVIYIDYPLAYYRDINLLNRLASNKNIPKRIKLFKEVIIKHVISDQEYYQKKKNWVDYCIARLLKRLGYYYISEIEPRTAIQPLIESLKFYKKDPSVYFLLFCCFLPKPLLSLLGKIKRKLTKYD